MKYKEQQEKGMTGISLFVKKDTKARWEAFAKENGLPLSKVISLAVERFMKLQSDTEGTIQKTASSMLNEEDKEKFGQMFEEFGQLMRKMDSKISILEMGKPVSLGNMEMGILEFLGNNRSNMGYRVTEFGLIKAAFRDYNDEQLYSTLGNMVKAGKIQATEKGWRKC